MQISQSRPLDALKAELSDKRRKGLKRDRYVLLRRPKDLNEREKLILELWLQAYPTIRQAYDLKEAFYKVYEAADRQAAASAYDQWRRSIPTEMEGAFKDLTTAIQNWKHEIFNYFDHPITNAYTEALNGMIKVTNRLGRGYSFEVIRAKMLYEGGLTARLPYLYRDQFAPVVDHRSIREAALPRYEIWLEGTDLSTLAERIERGEFDPDSTSYSE